MNKKLDSVKQMTKKPTEAIVGIDKPVFSPEVRDAIIEFLDTHPISIPLHIVMK